MIKNEDYKFTVSLSKEWFENKEISDGMIGSSRVTKNREIRKKYGFTRGVSFSKESVTDEVLLEKLLNGHVFCHLFSPEQVRKDNTFGSSQKTYKNFVGSYVIGVDIDKTNYCCVGDFIDRLSLPPTFYYTTYNHLQKDKGPRFRLIYVFDQMIPEPYSFRYCGHLLNRQIETDTQECIEDNCNLMCSQYFNGTNINNPNLNVEYGITHNIYSLTDFGYTHDGYIQYLTNYCDYKTYTRNSVEQIGELLCQETNRKWSFDRTELRFKEVYSDSWMESIFLPFKDRNLIENEGYSPSIMTVLYDWTRLDVDEFVRCSEWIMELRKIHYVYRVEKGWIDNTYQFVDDDYFSLFWNTKTVRDGEKRRKNLYQRMCLRRVMKPDITKNEMVVNTIIDIIRHYDNSDGVLDMDFIIRNVDSCFDQTLEDIKINHNDEIEYLKQYTRPKRGIIYKNRRCHTKETTFKILDEYYDSTLSIKDNYRIINEELEFKIGKSTLYQYSKNRGLITDPNKRTDEEITSLLDVTLSVRKNRELLKEREVKCSLERVSKLLKKKRGHL